MFGHKLKFPRKRKSMENVFPGDPKENDPIPVLIFFLFFQQKKKMFVGFKRF